MNYTLLRTLPGIAAVLLIQGLSFQFQTVSIIKCTYFDKKRPIITDNSKK